MNLLWAKDTIFLLQKAHNKALYYEEIEQASSWSGGPMIFTALKQVLIKADGQVIRDDDLYFAWVLDPGLKEKRIEYDPVKGHYYV